jgi:GntR family transcriptional regulator
VSDRDQRAPARTPRGPEPHPDALSLPDRLRAVWRDAADEGSSMPGEPVLANLLGVSRPALREALVRLEAEGLIGRRKGADTVVNRSALEMPIRLDRQTPFEIALERAGYATTIEVLESGEIVLDPEEAATLQRDVGSPALRTVKRWRADGEVAMVAVDVVPLPAGVHTDGIDPLASVFDTTTTLHGETAVWESAWPRPCAVAPPLDAWLELPDGTPILALDLVGISRGGSRGYLATEYHVPGRVPQGFIRCLVS